jgi:hypothetical protein
VTEEKSKNTIPKPIWGLPELVWAGILRYSKSGSPIFGLVVHPIWGPTYMNPICGFWKSICEIPKNLVTLYQYLAICTTKSMFFGKKLRR